MADQPSKNPEAARDFRVGEWLVQPSLDRLSRGDTQVHLRPQLTNLLVALACRAGRTVSKDAIIQEVWATPYVGESVLTRCITELRQALHDDARAPKVIETITKRGYRLIAPVVFLGDAPPEAGGDDRRTTPPAGIAAPPCTLPADIRDTAQSIAPSQARLTSRAVRTALKAVAVVGVAVTVGAGDWSRPIGVSERAAVLVADIDNTTGNRAFDGALRLALAVNVERAPFLRVLPQAAGRAALARMGRSPDGPLLGPLALEVCRREGAAVLLAGSIAPLGSRYALGIEAVACGTGESLGREIAEASDAAQVLTVLEREATAIRLKLGESRTSWSGRGGPLARDDRHARQPSPSRRVAVSGAKAGSRIPGTESNPPQSASHGRR